MTYDPEYVAKVLKEIRTWKMLTQANVAEAANLTTRTIEKLESGKHVPQLQTIRSLARALNVPEEIFVKPTPQQLNNLDRYLKRTIVVDVHRIDRAKDFMNAVKVYEAYRFDFSEVEEDGALEVAVAIQDWVKELDFVWGEMSAEQQLTYARNVEELCASLTQHGYACYMGYHKQRQLSSGKSPLVFAVGLVAVLKVKPERDVKKVIVTVEDGWEIFPEDRLMSFEKTAPETQ